MKVVLFGATGMIGQGVLRECLLAPDVTAVVAIGRASTGQQHPKLREIVHKDLHNLSAVESQLSGLDACFFCIGVTSMGMTEAQYRPVTYAIPVAAAETLCRLNPQMTFVFVSAAGADSTEHGKVMWARVKGAAENAVLRTPFKAVYVMRPAVVVPLHGIESRTAAYRILYKLIRPLLPAIRALVPKYVSTTEKIGQTMLRLVREGAPKRLLENADF